MLTRRFVGPGARACRLAAVAGLFPVLAACSQGVSGAGHPAVGGGASLRLTATLSHPLEIDLHWPADGPSVDGYVVEYATGPRDAFTVLGMVPATATTFRHANLPPDTTFLYRVRPYSGSTSNAAEVVAGTPGAAPGDLAGGDLAVRSLSATSVELRWKARPGGDGCLIERTASPREPFRADAILGADASSYVVTGLPANTRHYFRVRTFAYGPSSNVAERTTAKRTSIDP